MDECTFRVLYMTISVSLMVGIVAFTSGYVLRALAEAKKNNEDSSYE